MDALSDLLRAIRLTGGVFLEAELSAPWCITAQIGAEDCRAAMPEPKRVIAFHYVLDGRLLLQFGADRPLEVAAGAMVLLPHNDQHLLASEPGLRPVEGGSLMSAMPGGGLARIRHGGGGEITRVVCGFVGMDTLRHPLIDALPRSLVLDTRGEPAAAWIETSFRYAAGDIGTWPAGADIVLAKLSELLFVEAVRRHVAGASVGRGNWLAGLRDPVVGHALARMHARIAHPWTTAELAALTHHSRSAFAERFAAVVGMPPMRYLTAWRMQLAARRLIESCAPVARIAEEAGYASESAFTRAFKRAFGASPAAWRSTGRGPAEPGLS